MGEVVKFKPRYELEREGEYYLAFAKLTTFSIKPDEGNGGSKDKQNRAFWIGQPDTAPCEFTAPMDDPA